MRSMEFDGLHKFNMESTEIHGIHGNFFAKGNDPGHFPWSEKRGRFSIVINHY